MLTDPIRDVETDVKVRIALCIDCFVAKEILMWEGFTWIGKEVTINASIRPKTSSPTGKRYAY